MYCEYHLIDIVALSLKPLSGASNQRFDASGNMTVEEVDAFIAPLTLELSGSDVLVRIAALSLRPSVPFSGRLSHLQLHPRV